MITRDEIIRLFPSSANGVDELVQEFLANKGIPPAEQNDLYKLEIAYRLGYLHAVQNYAIWKNGVQYVGAMLRPFKEVAAEFWNEDVPLHY